MLVVKRDGSKEEFNLEKVITALIKAFNSVGELFPEYLKFRIPSMIGIHEEISVEEIQDELENLLMVEGYLEAAKSFIIYRDKHKELRYIKERAEYIDSYINSGDNAATASEVDANANIQSKNAATLEAELYKPTNVEVSRYRVVKKLKQMYGDLAPDYVADLKSHVMYKHDEGSAAAIKPYCVAVNLYPFMQKGTATLDKSMAKSPNNMRSFCGQFGNLAFLLSSQFQGAVAFGEFFNVFNYYCVKEWGENYYERDKIIVVDTGLRKRTISDEIEQAFQDITHTINQPAGNRSYQSPFTNISYYDSNYWKALFADFVYPDGSKPNWEAINYLQKKYMKWFNAERSKTLLTFPVETVALLTDGEDIIDQEYKEFVAEMYAAGHSFFTYMSNNADALSSCCRLKNKLDKNEFSFTNGLTGVATGSKSVITLNLNRIIQNCVLKYDKIYSESGTLVSVVKEELVSILKRVYKYHSAYNELLWDMFDKNMFPVYSEGYINLNQQFLTIGINGLNEAAEFLGIKVSDNPEYQQFCNLITETINEQNRIAESKPYNKKHVLKFNTEFVPAENLAIKNYNWDKEDGYKVPEDRNVYNSYFYKPDDPSISILEKFRLHGRRYVSSLDGGVALHCNLEEHLTKAQYLLLLKYAVVHGTNYFTFNIPNSQCEECGFISKHPLNSCPKCGSSSITLWTRIIGYLRPIKDFAKGRRIEASRRVYSKPNGV